MDYQATEREAQYEALKVLGWNIIDRSTAYPEYGSIHVCERYQKTVYVKQGRYADEHPTANILTLLMCNYMGDMVYEIIWENRLIIPSLPKMIISMEGNRIKTVTESIVAIRKNMQSRGYDGQRREYNGIRLGIDPTDSDNFIQQINMFEGT